jgi:hypothetical protein
LTFGAFFFHISNLPKSKSQASLLRIEYATIFELANIKSDNSGHARLINTQKRDNGHGVDPLCRDQPCPKAGSATRRPGRPAFAHRVWHR